MALPGKRSNETRLMNLMLPLAPPPYSARERLKEIGEKRAVNEKIKNKRRGIYIYKRPMVEELRP